MHFLIDDFIANTNMLTVWGDRLTRADFSERRSFLEDLGNGVSQVVHVWYEDARIQLTLELVYPHQYSDEELDVCEARFSFSYLDENGKAASDDVGVLYSQKKGYQLILMEIGEKGTRLMTEISREWPNDEPRSESVTPLSEENARTVIERLITETLQHRRSALKRRFARTGS